LAGRLLFDVTGQLQWYANLRNASGIQRVTEHILGSTPIRDYTQLEFIARAPGSAQFFRLAPQAVLALCDNDRRRSAIARLRGTFAQAMRHAPFFDCVREVRYFDVPYLLAGWAHLEGAIARLNGGELSCPMPALAPIVPPDATDCFLNTGDFWCHRRYVDSLLNLKRSTGVRVVVLVHDLFYLDNPEWNHPNFDDFAAQLKKLAPHVNVWLVTSMFVKSQLQAYLKTQAIFDSDVRVLPMGGGLLTLQRPLSSNEAEATLHRFGLVREGYFLSVGKIEPRRNYMALLDAFAHVRSRGVAPLPTCVIVGQDGWKSGKFRARLRATANEQHTVKWLRDVSDRELSILYSNALFCVVPSVMEGWGLPIRESIAHGVPCLASNAGGAVEAGKDSATYFDPSEPESLAAALSAWLNRDETLKIARTWSAAHRDMRGLGSWELTGKAVLDASKYPC